VDRKGDIAMKPAGDAGDDDGLRLDDLVEYLGRLSAHPSYFTLANFASGSRLPGVGEHVTACETCRAAIEALALEGGARGREKALRTMLERP
jgi:hypothetical protein